jgi:hypothetical protein
VQQLKQQCSSMAAVLPFASTTIVKASSSTQAEIYFGLAKAVDVSAGWAVQLCRYYALLHLRWSYYVTIMRSSTNVWHGV